MARSVNITASQKFFDGSGKLHGFIAVETGGVNPITVTVYDGVDATGAKVIPAYPVAANAKEVVLLEEAINVFDGLYVAIAGTGTADVNVIYS